MQSSECTLVHYFDLGRVKNCHALSLYFDCGGVAFISSPEHLRKPP